jgi:hypothetical protein
VCRVKLTQQVAQLTQLPERIVLAVLWARQPRAETTRKSHHDELNAHAWRGTYAAVMQIAHRLPRKCHEKRLNVDDAKSRKSKGDSDSLSR